MRHASCCHSPQVAAPPMAVTALGSSCPRVLGLADGLHKALGESEDMGRCARHFDHLASFGAEFCEIMKIF